MRDDLEELFPRLKINTYTITSPRSSLYNCVAWAAGEDSAWWWSDPMGVGFWPEQVPRQETMDSFVRVFAAFEYEETQGGEPEPGYEKIALFSGPSGKPTHLARQLPDGSWTRKLGKLEDIDHRRLDAVAGAQYGQPTLFMKRPVRD